MEAFLLYLSCEYYPDRSFWDTPSPQAQPLLVSAAATRSATLVARQLYRGGEPGTDGDLQHLRPCPPLTFCLVNVEKANDIKISLNPTESFLQMWKLRFAGVNLGLYSWVLYDLHTHSSHLPRPTDPEKQVGDLVLLSHEGTKDPRGCSLTHSHTLARGYYSQALWTILNVGETWWPHALTLLMLAYSSQEVENDPSYGPYYSSGCSKQTLFLTQLLVSFVLNR